MPSQSLIPSERIEKSILLIRGEKVMLDADLASLYDVSTGRLNEQVKRNLVRFPKDFAFQLTKAEHHLLISQNAISKSTGRGGRRKLPWVFTEHGILMLSSVLRSERAVAVNVEIMRTFVRLRQLATSSAHLARKLNALEEKYDKRFKVIFDAIRLLMAPPEPEDNQEMGFRLPKNTTK